MKIELNIDIEKIFREEIRSFIRDCVVINDIKSSVNAEVITKPEVTKEAEVKNQLPDVPFEVDTPKEVQEESIYEYAPRKDKRRNKTEIALHEAELKVKRQLTPEEKGQVRASLEIASETEEKAKDTAKAAMLAKQTADNLLAKVREDKQETAEIKEETQEIVKKESALFKNDLTDVNKIPEAKPLDFPDSLFK